MPSCPLSVKSRLREGPPGSRRKGCSSLDLRQRLCGSNPRTIRADHTGNFVGGQSFARRLMRRPCFSPKPRVRRFLPAFEETRKYSAPDFQTGVRGAGDGHRRFPYSLWDRSFYRCGIGFGRCLSGVSATRYESRGHPPLLRMNSMALKPGPTPKTNGFFGSYPVLTRRSLSPPLGHGLFPPFRGNLL